MSTESRQALTVAESPNRNSCLLVLLKPRLTLTKDLTWPLKAFEIDGEQYRDLGLGEWTGFYDWLRDSRGDLLGIRHWFSAGTEFLADYSKDLAYVSIDPLRHIEIFFSERRMVEPARSCDQAFLYDAVFRSDKGGYALAFGMEELDEADFKCLERECIPSATLRFLD